MKTQGALREFGIVAKYLDEAIERLIQAPLDAKKLVNQLQTAAEMLGIVLSANQASASAHVITPLVAAIRARTDRIRLLLDSAAALSGGLMSNSTPPAISYGAAGEERSDPAGWRMRLEA